jgi:hypothetical protein
MSTDPHFPNLPLVSDAEFEKWTEQQKFARHVLEIAEVQKIFDARQVAGMDIFDAAEGLPIPRMNRKGAPQAAIRVLYQEPPPTIQPKQQFLARARKPRRA